MDIPDDLICLFSARIERHDGSYVIEVPEGMIDDPEETYRVGLFESTAPPRSTGRGRRADAAPEPPVEEGDVREVEIEGIGDQGDGIAKVDRGYVLIVPGTQVGDRVSVRITDLHENFAIAEVIDDEEPEADFV